jgi:hypothetical protein
VVFSKLISCWKVHLAAEPLGYHYYCSVATTRKLAVLSFGLDPFDSYPQLQTTSSSCRRGPSLASVVNFQTLQIRNRFTGCSTCGPLLPKLFGCVDRARRVRSVPLVLAVLAVQADPLLHFPITLEAGTGMASKFLPPYALAAAVGSEIWSSPLKSYWDVLNQHVRRSAQHSGSS